MYIPGRYEAQALQDLNIISCVIACTPLELVDPVLVAVSLGTGEKCCHPYNYVLVR